METPLKPWMKVLISIPVLLVLPLYLLIRFSIRIFNKDAWTFKQVKTEQPILRYVVDAWLGEKERAQNRVVFITFLFPALFAYVLFVMVPFLQGMYLSMTNWNGLNNGNEVFTGLTNYKAMVKDVMFYYSFSRTIIYSFLNVIVINVVAFLLALLVVQNTRLKNVYRAGFFMPNLIGGLVLGYIWQFIFNRALTSFGGIFTRSFIANPQTAIYALIAVVTWQYAGYIMMIYVAALQNVPQDLVEASKIDGANALQRLRAVTMPLIQQALTVATFLTLVTSFKQYDTVLSLTQAGPFSGYPVWFANLFGVDPETSIRSLTLVTVNIYNTAFAGNQLGVGQAKAIVFFFFLLIISLTQVYFNKRKEIEL